MDYMIYLLLGVIIIYVEISRKRTFAIDHLSAFHFFFFLVYSFTPIALMYFGTDILARDLALGKFYLWQNKYVSLFILLSYFALLAGYYNKTTRKIASRVDVELMITRATIMRWMPLVYLFMFTIFFTYVTVNGGLAQVIANAELYRGGVIFAKYGFLIRAFALNKILLFYFFYLVLLEKDKEFRTTNLIFFAMSIIFFLLLAALYNSRGYIVLNFLGFYIVTVIYHRKYFLNILLLAVTFGYLVVQYADPLFHAVPVFLDYGFDAFLATLEHRLSIMSMEEHNIVANFSHPIISLETSLCLSGVDVEFRYFVDMLHGFIALLPSVLLGFKDPQYIMELNTELVYGEKISIALPGILALFSYSLHFVGMLIGMYFYGLYGGILAEIFRSIYKKYNAFLIFVYTISMAYGYFVFRGSPKNAMFSMFIILVVLGGLLFVSKITYKKTKE